MTEGNTAVSKHMALFNHKKEDIEFNIIDYEKHRYKRWIKEALAIREINPDMNDDTSTQFVIPHIYSLLESAQLSPRFRTSWNHLSHNFNNIVNCPPQ